MQGPLSMKLECISEIFNAHGDFFLLNSNCNLAIPFSAITAIPYSTTLLMLNKGLQTITCSCKQCLTQVLIQ